jgi:outer membrane protein OmpA-like peptidoglycan-associated protein
VLTARGRQLLDELAPKMTGFTQKGTEVVVVSYADPKGITAELALPLTKQRSDTVMNYLKDKHSIHGPGWLSSARKVTAVGMGVRPAPLPESDNPPAARTEVLVFVPPPMTR